MEFCHSFFFFFLFFFLSVYTVPGKQKEPINFSAHSIAVNNDSFYKSCLLFEVDRNKASCYKVIITWKKIMLDCDSRVLNDCHKVGSRCTGKGAPETLWRFPGNSWGGSLSSWCILLLHEISALFPCRQKMSPDSLGTQSGQIRQQNFLVWLDEELRSICFLCALRGPAIKEWLRASESAAWVCAHTLKCVGLSCSLGTELYFLRKQECISSRSAGLCIIFT